MTNIERAKDVLPGSGWEGCGLIGRNLNAGDLAELTNLGGADPNFAWERSSQDSLYYHTLLNFRLDHYSRYGFGVQGLWRDNDFVGQFGLQVLDDAKDWVEFVVFLGRSWRNQGLGGCLSEHLLRRCLARGLTEIYGVVRVDNPEALALLTKMGGRSVGVIEHFGFEARVFSVDLRRGS